MIYNDMICKSQDLFNINLEESTKMIQYLTESLINQRLKSIIEKLKIISAEIKDKDIDPKEIKEELEDIYDDIRSIGTIKNEDNASNTVCFSLLTIVFGIITYIFAQEENFAIAAVSIIVSIFMLICTKVTINRQSYDKVYDILIKTESKAMLEKKKAKESNDTKYEKQMDRLIEFIEEFKAKRRDEYKNSFQESSTIVVESDKSDIKVNNFKQAVDEIDRYLNIAFDKIKMCSSTTLFMVRKALTMNNKNKDKLLNEIIDKGNAVNDEFDKGEIINVPLADSLIRKWGNTFSSKYTSYGMEVRESFEKKLSSFNEEVIDYINKFNDELSTLVCKKKGESIKDISQQLYTSIRHNASVETADKVNDIIATWYNGYNQYYYFIDREIQWAQSMMKSTKIKSTLRYKIFSKFTN